MMCLFVCLFFALRRLLVSSKKWSILGLWQILSFAHKSSLDYLVIMFFVSWYSEMSGKDLVRMLMHFVCMFALLKT